MADSGSIRKDGTEIDYLKFGGGRETLVIIHGLSTKEIRGAGFFLSHYFRVFRKKYTVYLFDRKRIVPKGYSVADIAEDVVYAMEKLGIEKADFLGVSQGGMIAQTIAIRYPDRVNRMVLAVTAARVNDVMRQTIGKWIEYAEQGDYAAINTECVSKLYSEEYVAKFRFLLPLLAKQKLTPAALEKFRILANACLTFDCYGELDRIRCPVMVLGGRQDQVVSAEASKELAEKLSCPLYIYHDYGHAAYDEAKDFYPRVLAFLSESKT